MSNKIPLVDWFQVQGKFISGKGFCKIKIKEMILGNESKVMLTKSMYLCQL